MPAPSVHRGDQHFQDAVTFGGSVSLPNESISGAKLTPDADVEASKLEHLHRLHHGQPNTAATTETRVVYECHGATGEILAVTAGSIAKAVGDSTATVDVKKNGTTVLSTPITLDNANTNRVSEAGTLSVDTLADGDVLEVVITATVGTGTLPTGVWVSINVSETYA